MVDSLIMLSANGNGFSEARYYKTHTVKNWNLAYPLNRSAYSFLNVDYKIATKV